MILLDVNNKAVFEALCLRFENALANHKPETTELIVAGNFEIFHLFFFFK